MKLLKHPWHLASGEAAKTLAGHPEATDEQLVTLVETVFSEKSLFPKTVKDTVAEILSERAGDQKPEWMRLVSLYRLAEL